MSHPVFLNDAPYDHMPNGSANEWSSFFSKDGQELEANAFFPLLWMALFAVEDLRWARLIDDEDMDSPAREDLDVGDIRYPYLVTSQEGALARFAQRKPYLQAELGPKYAGVVDAFEELIRLKYAPYILLRTSGLPDPEMQEPGLLSALADGGIGPGQAGYGFRCLRPEGCTLSVQQNRPLSAGRRRRSSRVATASNRRTVRHATGREGSRFRRLTKCACSSLFQLQKQSGS